MAALNSKWLEDVGQMFLLYPRISLAVPFYMLCATFYVQQAQVKSLTAFITLDAVFFYIQVCMRKTEILKWETYIVHALIPLTQLYRATCEGPTCSVALGILQYGYIEFL